MKSIEGNICAQLFTDGELAFIIPMISKAEIGQALNILARDVGIPNMMIRDGSLEQKGDNTNFTKALKQLKIESRTTEPYTPSKNRAKDVIGIIKGKAKGRRIKINITKRLWDYRLVWEAEIYSKTSGRDGRNTLEKATGNTIDISE